MLATNWGSSHPLFRATIELDQTAIHYPWNEQQWISTNSSSSLVLHWLDDQALRGFALYQLSPLEGLAHLLKIAMVPEARGKGEAGEFWQAQIMLLRAQSFERVYLEVAVSNEAAKRFYNKMGLKMLREVRSFYHDGQNAWTMELAI